MSSFCAAADHCRFAINAAHVKPPPFTLLPTATPQRLLVTRQRGD